MRPAVHRTVLVVDVVEFGDNRRTNAHQLVVRRGLYDILCRALGDADVPWSECDHEDRGDGVLVLIPPTVPKSALVESLPHRLLEALHRHNDDHRPEERIRLRMAVHAGEIHYDDHGVAGRAVNLAFRLVDAPVLREALAGSPGLLAIIASSWFFEEVIGHSPAADPTAYHRVRVQVKETDVFAWIRLSDSSRRPGSLWLDAPDLPVPQQLPTCTWQFVGRGEEVAHLMNLLDRTARDARTVVITAIDGTAGIGKTTLAMHWAHRIRGRFQDGQLHVNLRGFDFREPMEPGQALHGFLYALGVSAKAIPDALDEKAALFRSLIADRRMLIVLDNARSAEQVRPLLPGTPTCVVIITSRNPLDGLIVREGANRITLDLLSTEDAVTLLVERIGRARVDVELAAAFELVDLCARLPLALSIAAARAAGQPRLRIVDLVRELRDEHNRLDKLDLGDTDLSLRAVFSWSYQMLSRPAANLFRRLGVHPGPDIDVHGCAALAGMQPAGLLRELSRAQLTSEYEPGRFRFHDLLRVYAAELAGPETDDAVEALLSFYLQAALLANRQIQPHRSDPLIAAVTHPVVSLPAISTYADAMAWFAVEIASLLSLTSLAAERGFATYAWRLAWAVTTFLRRTGRCRERVAVHRAALAACRRGGDLQGCATAARHLASALNRLGQRDEALGHLRAAIETVRYLGDEIGEHKVHLAYAGVFQAQGRAADAFASARQAWNIARRGDNCLQLADAFTSMGRGLFMLERYLEAAPLCERALELYSSMGHLEGQADVLITIGDIERNLGRHAAAVNHYRRSLGIDRQLGDRYWEAIALEHIGDTYQESGDSEAAEQVLRQALTILLDIHHREARRIRAKVFPTDGNRVHSDDRTHWEQ